MTIAIPKRLGHIWIGHRPAPLEWMQTWRNHHLDWEYVLYDNEYLFSRRWKNQPLINEYFRRGEYAGVSDLMRYEILEEEGGFLPEADSACLRPTDELWTEPALYTVYENEEKKAGLVSPFLASVKGHPYLTLINRRIRKRNQPDELGAAWWAVGNKFLKRAMATQQPENLIIFPSHYFIPQHKGSPRYDGDGPVYCDQFWGSTLGIYQEPEKDLIDTIRADLVSRLPK